MKVRKTQQAKNQEHLDSTKHSLRRRKIVGNIPYVEPESGRVWSPAHRTRDDGMHCAICGAYLSPTETMVIDLINNKTICYPFCPHEKE